MRKIFTTVCMNVQFKFNPGSSQILSKVFLFKDMPLMLWSRWRRKKTCGKGASFWPLRMHFQHSGAKIGVFEQNWANFQRKVGVKNAKCCLALITPTAVMITQIFT